MDPERPIEKKLRDYGKSRCERAGDLRLHPATRRMLHGEVARTYGAPREGRSRFFDFWPKLAWSCGLVALVLFVAIISSRETESGYQLAGRPKSADMDKTLDLLTVEPSRPQANRAAVARSGEANKDSRGVNEPVEAKTKSTVISKAPVPLAAPARAPERRPAAAPADTVATFGASASAPAIQKGVAAAPTAAVPGKLAAADQEATQVLADSVTAAPSKERAAGRPVERLVAGLAVTNGVSEFAQAGRSQIQFNRQVASSPAVIYERIDSNVGPALLQNNAEPETTQLARRFSTDKLEQTRTESFMANQSYVRTPTPQAMGAWNAMNNEGRMLSNFRMQQTDRGLEVVDEDGSVYTGQMELVTTNAAPSGGYYVGARISVAEKEVPEEPTLRFRVAGTNKSLNQAVVFSGQIMPQTAVLNNQSSALNYFNNTNAQLGLSGGSNQMFNNSHQLNNSQLLNNQFQFMPMLQNSRISGKVRVGSEETEINATPRNP